MPSIHSLPSRPVSRRPAALMSVAVGAAQLTAALHTPASLLTVMSAGVPEKTGFSPSVTVMSKLAVV